jgi:hypothetical protein
MFNQFLLRCSEKNGVTSYPTLKYFTNQRSVIEYKDRRQKDDIVNFVRTYSKPPVVLVNSVADAKSFNEDVAKVTAIAFFEKDIMPIYVTFAEEERKHGVKFAFSTDVNVAAHYGVKEFPTFKVCF